MPKKNAPIGQGGKAHYIRIYYTLNCANTLHTPLYIESFSYFSRSTHNIGPCFCITTDAWKVHSQVFLRNCPTPPWLPEVIVTLDVLGWGREGAESLALGYMGEHPGFTSIYSCAGRFLLKFPCGSGKTCAKIQGQYHPSARLFLSLIFLPLGFFFPE